MDQDTYNDKSVSAAASDFICVKIDGDRHRDLIKKYNIRGYPTTLFLNDKGAVIQEARGYIGPGRFNKIMSSVLAKYSPRVEKAKKKEKDQKSPFELSGIFYSSQAPKAVVNNTMVGVGDIIGGAEVIKISETEVTLSYRGKEIKLRIE
jgi:thioredoxin-related protein